MSAPLTAEAVEALESLCKTGIEATAGIEGLQKLNATYATALALAAFWREHQRQPESVYCRHCGRSRHEHYLVGKIAYCPARWGDSWEVSPLP